MKFRIIQVLLVLGVLASGCGEGYKYNRLVKKELARGVRYDSLFLGLYLGMPQRDFYLHCWQLNRKGLIKQGSGNTTVYYKMSGFKDTVDVNFYPYFYHGKMWRVPVKLNYLAWAPWNKGLYSDTLEKELINKFRKWYGEGFHEVLNADKQIAYYKIDGNRLISIFKEGNTYVWIVYSDLMVLNELDKLKQEKADSISAKSDLSAGRKDN